MVRLKLLFRFAQSITLLFGNRFRVYFLHLYEDLLLLFKLNLFKCDLSHDIVKKMQIFFFVEFVVREIDLINNLKTISLLKKTKSLFNLNYVIT